MDHSEHFTREELACRCCGACEMQQETLDRLEMMRSLAGGRPIRINSAYRCVPHNAEVGGAATSSHLSGLAIDMAVPDGRRMYELVAAAIGAGFPRIEQGIQYLHVDVDDTKPSPWMWINPAGARETKD